jgi:glycosyltransferase involved in cell wall biosynthesis
MTQKMISPSMLSTLGTRDLIVEAPGILPNQEGVTLVTCVKDEALRLPFFFKYYAGLGVDHFIIIDSGSCDETLNIARKLPNALIVHAPPQAYSLSNAGVDWVNHILDALDYRGWVLMADADELLMWPGSNEGISALCHKARAAGMNRIFTPMLDAYPEHALSSSVHKPYQAGTPFWAAAPWIDPWEYYEFRVGRLGRLRITGGPRDRLLQRGTKSSSPQMSKQSLAYYGVGGTRFFNSHFTDDCRPSSIVAPLVHYKLLSDLGDRARRAIVEGQHYNNAAEWKDIITSEFLDTPMYRKDSVMCTSGDDLRPHIVQLESLIKRNFYEKKT